MDDSLTCTAEQSAPRLDRWLATQWPQFSRARWQKALVAGLVTLNGAVARASDSVAAGDAVAALPPPAPNRPCTPWRKIFRSRSFMRMTICCA